MFLVVVTAAPVVVAFLVLAAFSTASSWHVPASSWSFALDGDPALTMAAAVYVSVTLSLTSPNSIRSSSTSISAVSTSYRNNGNKIEMSRVSDSNRTWHFRSDDKDCCCCYASTRWYLSHDWYRGPLWHRHYFEPLPQVPTTLLTPVMVMFDCHLL